MLKGISLMWDFFSTERWLIATAIVCYIAGARIVIIRRANSREARYGVRYEAGAILCGLLEIAGIGVLIYMIFAVSLVAALVSFAIAMVAQFVLAAMKGLFYPFLE
jgi:hypothetical protein